MPVMTTLSSKMKILIRSRHLALCGVLCLLLKEEKWSMPVDWYCEVSYMCSL